MNFIVYPGFLVYEKHGFDHSNVFISQHSGPSLGFEQDRNTDKIALSLMNSMGGNLIISTIPRHSVYGVDYNRMAPNIEKAIEYFKKWEKGIDISKYQQKYAWVAKNKKEHKMKERLFKTFWHALKHLGFFYVFLHTSKPYIKNYPSAIDIISFGGEGVDKILLEKIIKEANKKYEKFFKKIKPTYTKLTYEYQELKYKMNKFDIKYLKTKFKNVNENNYLLYVKKLLKQDSPKITIDTKFTGALAYGPKTELYIGRNNVVLEIEINYIFSEFYFNECIEILSLIMRQLKHVKRYQMLGFTQTQIMQFLESE